MNDKETSDFYEDPVNREFDGLPERRSIERMEFYISCPGCNIRISVVVRENEEEKQVTCLVCNWSGKVSVEL